MGILRAIVEWRRPQAWKQASQKCKQDHPVCQFCGLARDLEAHDVLPYHLWPNPKSVTYQEWYANMITLCRVKGWGCHILHGHCGDSNGLRYNPQIRQQADAAEPFTRYCK